jgi:GGDEF domain-containing protein
MARTNLLFLGNVSTALALQSALGGSGRHADTPLAAARALGEGRPTAIVLKADSAWACDLVASLSAAECPAILAVGERTPAAMGLVDGWLPVDWGCEEAHECWNRALARARSRRFLEGKGADDATVGLSSRRALLRALVGGGERARRQRGALSAVVFRIDGGAGDLQIGGQPGVHWLKLVASTLRRQIRRNETCGHLAGRLCAVVVHGNHKSALGARARLERLLAQNGLVARFEAFELDLRRPVQDLRWRASLLQGLSRRAREPRVAAAAFG